MMIPTLAQIRYRRDFLRLFFLDPAACPYPHESLAAFLVRVGLELVHHEEPDQLSPKAAAMVDACLAHVGAEPGDAPAAIARRIATFRAQHPVPARLERGFLAHLRSFPCRRDALAEIDWLCGAVGHAHGPSRTVRDWLDQQTKKEATG